jgi:hypothetical protein
MNKWLLVLFCLLAGTSVHAQLRKQRLFKVDPLSFVFKELRVAVEHRLFKDKDYFWYLAPYGYHQFWKSRSDEPFRRPEHPQKYYGIGLRAGARRYFIPQGTSPHGFFVQAHTGFRHLWLHNYNTDLQLTDKTRFYQFKLGGTLGYQWITGPRKDFAYGFIGGFEYFTPPVFPRGSGYETADITSNWYEFPFLAGGHSGFRLYLGIELGFAFLQRDLHW